LGTPRPVNPVTSLGLESFLGELPSILNNVVDYTLIMAPSHTLVRLRNEVATIVSRPMGERNVEWLHHRSTAGTLRRLLQEKYGTAVADTSTVEAVSSNRNLAGSSDPPRAAAMPAAPRRPPSPPPPHRKAGSGSSSQPLYGVYSGPSAKPPSFSGPQYYAPKEGRSREYDPGYGVCFGGW